ncbi:SH3 domain-containing protein [Palleronia marisminoris]|uniref:Bacterial SH3 domain protein n=1 Tax=Palleronia marisminoris TaxID=315423 RepID=A0A1Y5TTN3_9RHOB|nr:SH3 domain-containing protein [Palleronia marisminoris]SFH54266.1 SH3 domain-containing protein [Palleronia marisminoris]SLN72032.1 Bacterial SH3 domain protein [Palleronia marisminoris]
MLRLTCILLAGIGITLTVAGRDLDTPAGGTDVVVARSDTDILDPGRIPLMDEAGAIERALEATRSFDPVQSAEASATATDARPASAEQLETEVAAQAVVNANRVNLRAGPSTSNQVLDQVVLGQKVQVLDRADNGWTQVRVVDTGREAYIFDRFLNLES